MKYNGFLLVNKPSGMTSHDVVHQVRKKIKQRQVGHAGTLDPMASGLLVVLLGAATKLSQFILEGDKRYHAEIQLGVKSATLDLDCENIERTEVRVDPEQLVSELKALMGENDWQVPIYSAVKVGGRKLYEYARAGEEVERPVKTMRFYDLEVFAATSTTIEFQVSATKGSFVRTLAEKLGESMGHPAVISQLTRVYSDPYALETAIDLEDIDPEAVLNQRAFIPMAETLADWPSLVVDGRRLLLLQNGQIAKDLAQELLTKFALKNHKQVKLLANKGSDLVALAEIQPGKGFCLRKVFASEA